MALILIEVGKPQITYLFNLGGWQTHLYFNLALLFMYTFIPREAIDSRLNHPQPPSIEIPSHSNAANLKCPDLHL